MPTWPQYQNALLAEFVNFVSKTSAYTASVADFVLGNATTGQFFVTLPSVGLGGPVSVKKTDASNNAIRVVTSDGSTIDGIAGATGVAVSAQYATVTLVSNGLAWYVIDSYGTPSLPGMNGWTFIAKTSAYVAVAGNYVLASTGGYNVTLPGSPLAGQSVAVKNVDGVGTVTVVTADSSTIDGQTGSVGVALAAQFETAIFVTDGTNWWSQSGGPVVAGL